MFIINCYGKSCLCILQNSVMLLMSKIEERPRDLFIYFFFALLGQFVHPDKSPADPPVLNALPQETHTDPKKQVSTLLSTASPDTVKSDISRTNIVGLLEKIDINPDELLTSDVLGVKVFTQTLAKLSLLHLQFEKEKFDYSLLTKKQFTQSEIKNQISAAQRQLQELVIALQKICNCIIGPDTSDLIRRAVLKQTLIQEAVGEIARCSTAMSDALQRLRVRTAQMRSANQTLPQGNDVRVQCFNTDALTWEASVGNNLSTEVKLGVMTVTGFLRVVAVIKDSAVTDVAHLMQYIDTSSTQAEKSYSLCHQVASTLLLFLPVMAVYRGQKIILVNLHELGVGDMLDQLLHLDLDLASVKKEQLQQT